MLILNTNCDKCEYRRQEYDKILEMWPEKLNNFILQEPFNWINKIIIKVEKSYDISITINFTSKNRDDYSLPITLNFGSRFFTIDQKDLLNPEELIYKSLEQCIIHELKESIYLNNKRIFEPHLNINYNPTII